MKRNMIKGKGRPAHALKTLIAGAALTVAFGFAMNAQAGVPDCTTANWSAAVGLGPGDTGHQGSSNRRYGGPCGLRVSTGSGDAYVVSDHPSNESSYHVRFYVFLNNAPVGGDVVLFATDAYSVMYHQSSGEVMLHADHAGGTDTSLSFPISTGWYSIHVSWASDANAEIEFLVANRNTDVDTDWQSVNLDTSGMSINSASLGNVDDTGLTAGSLDYDDFVSTRIMPPDRLLIADTDDNGVINVFDIQTVGAEVVFGNFAPGQPDCDEDGVINVFDIQCVGNIVVFGN